MELSELFKIQEQVESGGNPLAVSPKGAVGPMQTMPTTLSNPGYGVLAAKDTSITEQRRVGQDYMRAMLQEYGGDLPTALAAYNWGPGKVNKWRAEGADPAKLPQETRSYIEKITGSPMLSTQQRHERVSAFNAAVSTGVQSLVIQGNSTVRQQAEREVEQQARLTTEEARPTTFEQFGGAVAGGTFQSIVGAIGDRFFSEEFEPVEGYKPDLKALPISADRDLVDDYAVATSPQEAAHVLQKYEQEQFRVQTVMDKGVGLGLALSIGAEIDPVNVVTAVLAPQMLARAGMGSIALAARGERTASVASAITENVLSGTAVEAVKQGLEGRYSGQDLLVSLVADSLLGAGVGAIGLRSAEHVMAGGAEEALRREVALAVRAEVQLGPNATAGNLRAVMDELAVQDVNTLVKGATTDLPMTGKLVQELPVQADRAGVPEATPTAAFEAPDALALREEEFKAGGVHEWAIADRTGGTIKTLDELHALPAGVHYVGASVPTGARPAVDTAMKLARKFLGSDFRLTISHGEIPMQAADGSTIFAHAEVVQPSERAAMIRVDPKLSPAAQVRSVVHEMGHTIFNKNISKLDADQRASLETAFKNFLKAADAAPTGDVGRAHRFSLTNVDQGLGEVGTPKLLSDYERNWDEFSAEQFVKYVDESKEVLGLSEKTIAIMKDAINAALAFLRLAKREHLGVTNEYKAFFDAILQDQPKRATLTLRSKPAPVAQPSIPAKAPAVVAELAADPVAVSVGLNLAPVGTAAERKHVQAMLALHKKASAWAVQNPMDDAYMKRVQNLADNNVFNVASTGLIMLKSQNPLLRMLASELVEDASGVLASRNSTAAISKHIYERKLMGNAINDVQGAYNYWKTGKAGGLKDDLIGGKNWAAFNKELAAEIEARRLSGAPVSPDLNIKAAVDSIEAAYQRSANEQRRVGTLGADGLAASSVGYMPHRMSPKAVFNLSNEQAQIVHSSLVDQFVTIEGWDISFSDALAASYMKRVRDRAGGDYGSNIGGGSPQAASMVEEALRGMDLPEDTITEHMAKFAKGSANFTKKRIELDLNRVYKTAGGDFRLLDIFETNQIELLRSQVGRASGELALTRFGVRGKPGLKLLRDAVGYGADGQKTAAREFEAFDQMAAEFMNEPFGTQSGKFMERAMAANTLVRLGGIAFNQLAESINGIAHVGAARAMASVASIPRLRAEIQALVKGQPVNNPFIGSIELAGGAEFGTDSYKLVMPFDSPDNLYPTYGQDTLTLTDRLLRGGGHLQSKLSGWRLIHSAQQRGMAEQIVHKMMRFVREGKDDIALRQFGITPHMQAALKSELPQIATFDSAGNLISFDVTKLSDVNIREAVIQAVWRGTSQIIQDTYIGERGKWAHDGWLKMMTQFRTFSITSMEKQWGRQRNSRGAAGAFGLLMGAMSFAAPIYMARVYANSMGRPDQEQYLEERLTPMAVTRATLNYVTSSGMVGDFIDLTSAVLPEALGVKPTGGRSGVESDFVGNYVLPASSLVNDIWKYAQSPTELDDAAKILPFSRMPYIVPLMNATKSE